MSGIDLLLPQSIFWRMLLVALITGGVLGIAYDALCILRMLARDLPTGPPEARQIVEGKHRRSSRMLASVVRLCTDLFFAVLWAVALILLCYYTNDGQLRAPAVLGMACGFFVYRRLLSPLVLRMSGWILRMAAKVLSTVWRIVLACLGRLWNFTLGRLLAHMVAHHRARAAARYFKDLQSAAARGFDVSDPLDVA